MINITHALLIVAIGIIGNVILVAVGGSLLSYWIGFLTFAAMDIVSHIYLVEHNND